MLNNTEITEIKQETALVESNGKVLADFIDYSDLGAGFENVDKDAYAIPFIYILQKTSPIVDENKQQFIEGARAGMFFNTVTQECYEGKEKGILFVPCAYRRSYILWGSRETGGGFKGEFTKEQFDEIVTDPSKVINVNGKFYVPNKDAEVDVDKSDYYLDTRSHFIILINEDIGTTIPAIIALSSSQLKSSRMLMTSLNLQQIETTHGKRTLPMFASLVRAKTRGMENKIGQSWSGITFSIEGRVKDKNLFFEAKKFSADIIGNKISADFSKSDHLNNEYNNKPEIAEEF